MRIILRNEVLTAAAAAIGLLSAGAANASPMQLILTATDITNPAVYSTTFSDVIFGADTVTAESFANTIIIPAGIQGDIHFSGELATSTIGPPLNSLLTGALSVANLSTTDTYRLTAALSGMNFAGPVNFVALTGSGTWQSTAGSVMSLSFYDDPTNVLGASTPTDAPGNLVGSFTSAPADTVTSSYSYSPGSSLLGVTDTGPFSMTETWNYTLAPGGALVSRGQTESKALQAPEPASMLVFGVGLTALGLVNRRKNSRKASDTVG